jgi:acid phosphatase
VTIRRHPTARLGGIGAAVLALAMTVSACTSSAPAGGGASDRVPSSVASAATPPSSPSSLPSTSLPAPTPVTPSRTAPSSTGLPRPAHVVVVLMENHGYHQIIGNPAAPFLNRLARTGASFTQSYAITHPSQPNYLGLFSGSTHGVTDDSCPHRYPGPDLGSQVRAAGATFVGYAESLPRTGYLGCRSGNYARKHAPWTDFADLPASVSQPMTAFPADYTQLPTLAFVIPNLAHDMHNGTIAAGDQWLRQHLAGYVRWARTHNSLIAITWDEDDDTPANRIPTIIAGAGVAPGRYAEHMTQYRLLRTLEELEAVAPIGAAARTSPVRDIWQH